MNDPDKQWKARGESFTDRIQRKYPDLPIVLSVITVLISVVVVLLACANK